MNFKPSAWAVAATQLGDPNGRPLVTDARTARNSIAVKGTDTAVPPAARRW